MTCWPETGIAEARLRKASLFTKDDPEVAELMSMAAKKAKPAAGPSGHPFHIDFVINRKITWRYIFEQKIIDVDMAANELVLGSVRTPA